jgi:catecholate siderophore receptor
MNLVKAPRSLRYEVTIGSTDEKLEYIFGRKVSAVAGLIAVASVSGAEAQQSNLPPVTVDSPVARSKPAASKPTPDQIRARTALRRAARRTQPAQVAPVPFPNAGALGGPDRNPYADVAAPYKIDRLQSPGKFPEKLLNTAKTVTVLSKELLEDKNATTLKEAARTTAGVTLGTGEGGNAFGDRFFIRGFDARNDIFIDGVRDPGVSIRENFFTEQVEILRGPGSSFAGRGTTGGAINIVTKQATTEKSFYEMETSYGTDQTKRVTLDVNQVISPTLAVRAGGLFQDGKVAGRDYTTDDRNGAFVATTWKPVDAVKLTTGYIHTDIHGIPDFGVPYYRPNPTTTTVGGPFTEYGVNRNTFYGFVNRDFQEAKQDIGSINAEVTINPDLTLSNKFRVQRSTLNYVGTIPESPKIDSTNLLLSTITANPQSRYQVTDVMANQTEATYKFETNDWKHTALGGLEVSREKISIDSYAGLVSEQVTGNFTGSGSASGVSLTNPQYTFLPFGTPTLVGNPLVAPIDSKSVYLLDSANYKDLVILNGGIRYDDYNVSASNKSGSNSNHSGMFDYNVGVVLKPLPNASVYGAYATSSNPVGAELDGTSAAYGGPAAFNAANANQVFGPEKNRAIEVGTKWELFDRHLLVSGALFQTEKDNAREVATINGISNTVISGAAYRIQGIDLEAGGKITDKFSLFGGLVLMDSKVTKSNAPSPTPLLYPTNVGLKLANIAHQSFNMLAKYEFNEMWEIGGQATYRSKIYGGTLLAANRGTELPAYWRFDTFVEAKVDKNWTAKLSVNNITNKLYYDGFYQSAAPFVLVAPGRSATLTVSAKF